jgi:hypothetical protein
MSSQAYDRRAAYCPAPRPEWVQTVNAVGDGIDAKGIVPLDGASLIAQATFNTGLNDFGPDDWREPFDVLTRAIDAEADLHLAGRILTRMEFLRYLELRLQMADWYRRHPEVEDEPIDRPVFITGYGRSGTTILYEMLSQDPQFRVPLKWESLFPVPPPEEATYASDPRIAKTGAHDRLIEAITPEFNALHKVSGELPVEGLELELASFRSEIFPMIMHVPSYADYLRGSDLTSTFEWQRRTLKLLQSRFRRAHWLIKSPSHLLHLERYLAVFPGMRVVFAHRDPIVTADSVASFFGALYWQRSDNLWGGGDIDVEVLQTAPQRARAWDPVIQMIESGRLARGSYANFQYEHFVGDPVAAVRSVYDQLEMDFTREAEERMRSYIARRTKGQHGKHLYEQAPATVVEDERIFYRDYQRYFGVPDEHVADIAEAR